VSVLTPLRDPSHHQPPIDRPRRLRGNSSTGDQVFEWSSRLIGFLVLVLTGSIGLFLGWQLIPTIRNYGWSFFTEQRFQPEQNVVGISSAIVGSIQIAIISLVVAFPLALLTALYISEYAPARLQTLLISVIDLMAAVPSIVYGIWGVLLFQPHALFFARWISEWFGWIPIFHVNSADPHAATLSQSRYEQSAFMAGLVVAMMVIPLACAVMRGVFSQAPVGEREAAYALGSTRWGMIRAVVIPFGRGGIIGGTMLGLGRALGETVAVLLIVSLNFELKFRILENGTVSISSLIANSFGEAKQSQLSALLAAGFVLFAMTLVVNTIAAIIVARGRSGMGVDA
jgi:phosphate transport system permease protein